MKLFLIMIILTTNAFGGSLEGGASNAQSLIGTVNQSAPLTGDPKNSVPGFVSSNPTETGYSNGNMGDAATQKSLTDPAAQLINKSFATRPDIKIDRTNSPIFNAAKKVTDNPNAIIDKLTGKYGDCKAQTQTTVSSDIRTCDEYTEINDQTCQVGQNVVVDAKHQYKCNKNRNYTDNTCDKSLTVTCQSYNECAAGGIVLASIATDMKWVYSGNILTIGTIGDNYWGGSCAIYARDTVFTVNSLAQINNFILRTVGFDDYLEVKLNGALVYEGPYGGTTLETKKINSGIYAWNGIQAYSCELGTNWNFKPNIDLKPYLREGSNTLYIKVLVAGAGEGWVQIEAKQQCCSAWVETWSDGCVGYAQ